MDYMERFNELFEQLVPEIGPAETIAGELVSAVARIASRFYVEGDRIGVEYGNDFCNAAARYIMVEFPEQEFFWTVNSLWGLKDKVAYEKGVNLLIEQVLGYLDVHPELLEAENDVSFEDDYDEEDDHDWEDEYEKSPLTREEQDLREYPPLDWRH